MLKLFILAIHGKTGKQSLILPFIKEVIKHIHFRKEEKVEDSPQEGCTYTTWPLIKPIKY